MSTSVGLAWHYTTGNCAAGIVSDGNILPATGGLPPGELPVVWFSRLNRWEPTASKGIVDAATGFRRWATRSEMERFGNGLYRFGVIASQLLDWGELQRRALISRREAQFLTRSGAKVGALPANWMGTLSPVPLSQVVAMQRLIGEQWISDTSELMYEAAAG